MEETLMLMDPTADYCKALTLTVEGHIKKMVDGLYSLYLDCGMCKADAIWTAIEETQEAFNGVDLSVNFDGPMV